jgi:hypothetical protein
MPEKTKAPDRPRPARPPARERPEAATPDRLVQEPGQSRLPQRGLPSDATGPMGGNGRLLQQLQQAAGNRAMGQLLGAGVNGNAPASATGDLLAAAAPPGASPPLSRTDQVEAPTDGSGRTPAKPPAGPVARARALEEAVAAKQKAEESEAPEYAQSVELETGLAGEPPESAEAPGTPPAGEDAPAAAKGEGATEAEQQEQEEKAAEKTDEATAQLVEQGPEAEEEAEPVAEEEAAEKEVEEEKEETPEEDQAAEAAAVGAADQVSGAMAEVGTSVDRLMQSQAETANLAFQPVSFAPRPEESVKESRTAFEAARGRATSEAAAAAFLAHNVNHVQNLTALGATAPGRIFTAAALAKLAIDAAVVTNVTAVRGRIAGMRAQAQGDAAGAMARITTQRHKALEAIRKASETASGDVEKAHADTKATLDKLESDQVGGIETLYQTWVPKYRAVGGEVGAKAMATARAKANNWLSQRNGESSILDGPIHDNRLEAKADAAIKVAEEYQKGLQEEADKQAKKLQEGKPQVLEAVRNAAKEGRDALDQHLEAMKKSLQQSEESATTQIKTKADSLIGATQASLATTLASLTAQEAAQVARLFAYGESQKVAIDTQAALAVAALVAGTAEAVTGFNAALQGFVETALATEAPDQQELQPVLAELQVQADVLALTFLTQLEMGIVASEEGVANGGQMSVQRVNELGQSAIEQAQATGQQYASSTATMVAEAESGFTQLAEGHQKTVDEAKTKATEGFDTTREALTTTFEAIGKRAKDNFTNGRTELKNGLEREGLKKLDSDIEKYAGEAAAAVQPRWKKVAKWVITIAVVIAAVALTIVTAGSAGPIGVVLIGAAIGGLAGAAIQVGHNLVDGKKWSEGVGKAFVVGAIGGAFGGLGGVLAQGVANVGLKLGIEVGIDVVGGVIGDLAVGNPITLEGVLLGAAVGAGIGGGLALGSALKGKIKIKPPVEAPAVKPDVGATAPKPTAPEVTAPRPKAPEAPAAAPKQAEARTPKPAAEAPAPKAPEAPAPKPAEAAPPKAPEAASPPKAAGPEPAPAPKQKAHPDKPEVEDGIVAKTKTADGHEIKVTKDGQIAKCTVCEPLRLKYADELAADPKLKKRLDDIQAIDDPKVKAKKAAELEAELQNKKAKVEGEPPPTAQTEKGAEDMIASGKKAEPPSPTSAKVETLEEFLARGGKIQKVPSRPHEPDLFWEVPPDPKKTQAALGGGPEVEGVGIASATRAGMARPPRHHVFPQEKRSWFEARGMKGAQDIDRFTVPLEVGHHQAIHGGGNWRLGRTWSGEWNNKVMQVLERAHPFCSLLLPRAILAPREHVALQVGALQRLGQRPRVAIRPAHERDLVAGNLQTGNIAVAVATAAGIEVAGFLQLDGGRHLWAVTLLGAHPLQLRSQLTHPLQHIGVVTVKSKLLFFRVKQILKLGFVRAGLENRPVGMAGDEHQLLLSPRPVVQRQVVTLAQLPVFGRGVERPVRQPLHRPPDTAYKDPGQAAKPVAVERALMPVEQEQGSQHRLAFDHLQQQAVIDVERLPAEELAQVAAGFIRIAPLVVVVAPDANQAPRPVKRRLQVERALVGSQNGCRPLFPQLFHIPQRDERVAHAIIVGEGGVIGPFRRPKVVGPVARPAVQIG